jgi:hypothetical protein
VRGSGIPVELAIGRAERLNGGRTPDRDTTTRTHVTRTRCGSGALAVHGDLREALEEVPPSPIREPFRAQASY